jgi:hypothetical protein
MPQLGEHYTFALIIKVGAAALVFTSIGTIKVTPIITGAYLDRGLHRFCFELRFSLTLFFLFALKEIESAVKGLDIKEPVPRRQCRLRTSNPHLGRIHKDCH